MIAGTAGAAAAAELVAVRAAVLAAVRVATEEEELWRLDSALVGPCALSAGAAIADVVAAAVAVAAVVAAAVAGVVVAVAQLTVEASS